MTAKKTKNRHGTPIPPRAYARYRSRCHDRGNHDCPSGDRSAAAHVIDAQMEHLIKGLILPPAWQEALGE